MPTKAAEDSHTAAKANVPTKPTQSVILIKAKPAVTPGS